MAALASHLQPLHNTMGIFSKPSLESLKKRDDMPEGLWSKCPGCEAMIHNLELAQHHHVCHHCGHHFLMGSRERIELLADDGSFEFAFVESVSIAFGVTRTE